MLQMKGCMQAARRKVAVARWSLPNGKGRPQWGLQPHSQSSGWAMFPNYVQKPRHGGAAVCGGQWREGRWMHTAGIPEGDAPAADRHTQGQRDTVNKGRRPGPRAPEESRGVESSPY